MSRRLPRSPSPSPGRGRYDDRNDRRGPYDDRYDGRRRADDRFDDRRRRDDRYNDRGWDDGHHGDRRGRHSPRRSPERGDGRYSPRRSPGRRDRGDEPRDRVDDRRGGDRPSDRRRERSPELDEFGRVIPPPRGPTPPPAERRRESSASRERRRRERRERKREKREERRQGGANPDEDDRGAADYRESLYPPGSDTSLYAYDATTFWHVTPDQVWYFRPDLTLWYDCRNECYYTYDSSLAEYVSVPKDRATEALALGQNVAPRGGGGVAGDAAAAMGPASAALAAAAAGACAGELALVHGPAGDGEVAGDAAVMGPVAADEAAAAAAAAGVGEGELAMIHGPAAAPAGLAGAAEGVEVEEGEGGEGEAATVDAPVDWEELVARSLIAHTESWQGKKETQEDRFLQGTRLGRLGTAFGVFDGHGGVHAAEYVAKHLPNNIARCHQQRSSASTGASGAGRREVSAETRRLTSAMEEAFPLTDRELMNLSRRKQLKDGTTALIVLVHGTQLEALELLCAHVGDCRAVLCRGGQAVRLTQDHRPDRKDEQLRIRQAGGGVFQVAGIWRCTSAAGAARAVDARAGFLEGESHTYLSCSRTLGDPELKANPERPILSNQPDTSVVPLLAEDLFFVLACDGVWDVLSDQQVIDLVLEHWGDASAAASRVVRTALSSGSGDNLTAQVVFFSWRHELGVATASRRAREREEEAQRKPPPKPVVEEEDIDMFG